MISIDGSQGEGGGQVLRTSLSLAMVTGRAFRIENIRANRPKPGLMRQHLTAVKAACEVCGAAVQGAEIGSGRLEFTPGAIRGGDYTFSIGTAGSTTLVLQTLLPALLAADRPSTVLISGGTHNMHAPSVHFLKHAFLPILERMGAGVQVDLLRHGFYPAGGGQIRVSVMPVEGLKPVQLIEAGPVTRRRAVATIARLPASIARRELSVVSEKLGWEEDCLSIEQATDAPGPGNVLSIEIERGGVTEVFTGFGARGVSAERVAEATVRDVKRYLAAGAPVWRHLADQLMLPLAMAGGGEFETGPLSRHSETNAAVIESFLPVRLRAERDESGRLRVLVHR